MSENNIKVQEIPETEYVIFKELAIEDAPIPTYTEVEHGTWALLIEAQKKLLPGRACDEYLQGLENVNFPETRIPTLKEISDQVKQFTGWKLMRADGLVHPKDFFGLLSRKTFPSTDFIRKREELNYTPAPDMFHDLFGHTPLLTNNDFCDFFQLFGTVGVNAYKKYPDENHEVNTMLARTYWYTVEFGLIENPDGMRIFGSGQLSSPNEVIYTLTDKCKKILFDMDVVTHKDYDIWHMQEEVFYVKSWSDLTEGFKNWALSKELL